MKYVGSTTRDTPPAIELASLNADQLQFRAARYEILDRFNKAGHYGCLVFDYEYQGGGKFPRHLFPVDAKTLTYEVRGEITLDALYDKTKLYPKDLPHITDHEVGEICNDKSRTNELVGDLQPRSATIHGKERLLDSLEALDNGSGLVVVKGPEGYGGDQVWIGKPSDLAVSGALSNFPLLVQEFIETNKGVPGLIEGRHDVRVLILNGELLGGSVRSPKAGGFLSNTHQGGSMRMLELSEIPAELQKLAKSVDARLPQRPRLYAADFMYAAQQNRWFLIELNGSPGALPGTFVPVGPVFQEKLSSALLAIAS